MADTSQSALWTLGARGSHARNDQTQSRAPSHFRLPLSSGMDGGQHVEEIPLVLIRDSHTGPHGADTEATSGTQSLPYHHHQLLADHHDAVHLEDSRMRHAATDGDGRSPTDHARTWRPTWLHPAILLSFMALFLSFTFSLPLLFWYSDKNQGIVKTRPDFAYLWRFGPTAVLTLISFLWSRVELQALIYEPWIAHFQEQGVAKKAAAYDIDYTSLLPHTVLVRSLQRGHYFVFVVSAASLILKIQIALAPGLLSSVRIESRHIVDVHVLDLFNTSMTLATEDTTAYYAQQAFQTFDMRYPFGLTQSMAYETFGIGDQCSRGTVDAPLHVVVDGLFSETQCLKLESYSFKDIFKSPDSYTFTTALRFEGCNRTVTHSSLVHSRTAIDGISSEWQIQRVFLDELACPGLPQQTLHHVYSGIRSEFPPGNNSQPVLLDVAAVLCGSNSWISKVQVVDDGLNPIATALLNEGRVPVQAELWDMIGGVVPPEASAWARGGGPVQTAFALWQSGNYTTIKDDPSFYTSEALYEASTNISRVLGPWAGHCQLREKRGGNHSQTTLGFRTTKIDKLLVNKWVCLPITVLFIILTLSALIVGLRYRKRAVVHWYRDPATILGSMLFLRDNPELAGQNSRSSSCILSEEVNSTWGDCRYTPIVLRTWVRSTFSVFVVSTLTALCYTLALSKGIRRKLLAVTFTQLLVVFCGFLATLMSVVFTVENILAPIPQTSWLSSREIEYTHDARLRRSLAGFLALRPAEERPLNWPRNTYVDLLFPEISLGGIVSQISQNAFITLTVPAAKLVSSCLRLSNVDYSMIYNSSRVGTDSRTDYQITFAESFSCPDGRQVNLKSESNHSVLSSAGISYTASSLKSPGNRKDTNAACGELDDDDNYSAYRIQTYAWGQLSIAKNNFEYMSIWRCNYSWVEIPTEISVTFEGEYIITPEIGLSANLSGARPWTPAFDVPHLDDRFDTRKDHQLNDNISIGSVFPVLHSYTEKRYGGMTDEFNRIIPPHGRVSLEAFGDRSQEPSILRDLTQNYAIFAAQLANLENRLGKNETSRTGQLPSGSLPDLVGSLVDGRRRRLVQNPTITYAILAILCLVILMHVSALLLNIFQRVDGETWIFDMEVKGLAPDGLHSMAATVALLKDSNASKFLPEGAHLLSSDELHGQLADLRFQMGWFQDADGNRKYTVGVLGDDDFKFLGKKKDVEKGDA